MKRTLSIILAMVLVLSMSAMAFADTTPIAEIPADTMQAFIDDTPEGHYLAGTNVIPIDEQLTAYEAVYLPIVRPRYASVTGQKTVYVYEGLIGANIVRSDLTGTFNHDGRTAVCTNITANTVLLHPSYAGYTFQITNKTPRLNGDQGYVDLVYKVYSGYSSVVVKTVSNIKPTIACNPDGTIY